MFSNELRTTRFYYNAQSHNRTNSTVSAVYQDTQLKDLFRDTSSYDLAINRFRVPLNMPLTPNNIPFQKWQVGLSYTSTVDGTTTIELAYVPQYNQQSKHSSDFVVQQNAADNSYSIVKGIASNGIFQPNTTFQITVPIIGTLLSLGTPKYIIISSTGGTIIYIYSPEFTLLQTLDTTDSVKCICMDPIKNDIYAGFNNSVNGFYALKATYQPSSGWSVFDVANSYSSLSYPIDQPQGMAFYNNTLYVSNYADATIYGWNASGEPSKTFLYNRELLPSQMTVDAQNNQLVVAYDPVQTPYVYDDLYGTSTGLTTFDLTNGETQITPGDINSQAVVLHANVSGSSLLIAFSAYNYYTYSTRFPLASNVWQPFELTKPLSAIAVNSSIDALFSITRSNNILCTFNLSSSNNTWSQISPYFNINSNVSITSMDFTTDSLLVCTGSDNNVYLSNYPVVQRAYLSQSSLASNNLQLFGINNQWNPTNQTLSVMPINSFNESLNSNSAMCFDGTYFYVVNSSNTVDKYDAQFTKVTTYPFTECGGSILALKYGALSNYIYALSTVNNRCINMYSVTGAYLGSTSTIGLTFLGNAFTEITTSSDPILACMSSSSIINLINVSNPTSLSIVGTYITASNSVNGLEFNSSDGSIGGLYALEEVSYQVYGIVEKFNFQDNTFTNMTSKVIIINNPTANYKALSVSSEANEISLLNASNSNIEVYSVVNNYGLVGTVPLPNSPVTNSTLICLNNLAYIQFGQITNSVTVQSVCASKTHQNRFYSIQGGHPFQGNYKNNAITWYSLPNIQNTYTQISCTGYQVPNNSSVSTTQLTRFNTSLNSISTTNSTLLKLQYLALDYNNNLTYSGIQQDIITKINNGMAYSTLVVGSSGLFSYIIGAPEVIDSGPYSLYSYQDYLTQINSAFQQAFTALKSILGSSYIPTKAPRISFNGVDKMFYLVCSTDYDNVINTISTNLDLSYMLYLPSIDSTLINGFYQLVLNNDGSNVFNGFYNIYQETSTAYAFFDVARILVRTSKLPVIGDAESENTNIQIITDVVPDISSLTPGSALIYVPTILRWYTLYSTTPLKELDIFFSYSTKNGTIYDLPINPNEWMSCKIEFKKNANGSDS